jgi:hypothetical protein
MPDNAYDRLQAGLPPAGWETGDPEHVTVTQARINRRLAANLPDTSCHPHDGRTE